VNSKKIRIIFALVVIIAVTTVAIIGIPQANIMKPSPPVQPIQDSSVQEMSPLLGPCKALENDTLPDPSCTPGATNPDVKQSTIDSTICVSGYASSIRPSVDYTEPLKFKLMDVYGYADSPSNYELDHLIPIEIGGAPSDVRNLWPEPHYTSLNSYDKDRFENYLHDQVCSGKMDLGTAQNEIATNWVKYWTDVADRNYH
jgi:hypothetical protein